MANLGFDLKQERLSKRLIVKSLSEIFIEYSIVTIKLFYLILCYKLVRSSSDTPFKGIWI